jgi:hypothetical protein
MIITVIAPVDIKAADGLFTLGLSEDDRGEVEVAIYALIKYVIK